MDLTIKRIKTEPQTLTSSNVSFMKHPVVIKKEFNRTLDENSQDSDTNDSSDSERLQMDISSQDGGGPDDNDVVIEVKRRNNNNNNKSSNKNNNNNNNNNHHHHHHQQQHHFGRETPDSLTSDEQIPQHHMNDGTDPATTQLWHALAHHTSVNGAVGNEATQLLRKMINCRSLGLPFSSQLGLAGSLQSEQPMSLLRVN